MAGAVALGGDDNSNTSGGDMMGDGMGDGSPRGMCISNTLPAPPPPPPPPHPRDDLYM